MFVIVGSNGGWKYSQVGSEEVHDIALEEEEADILHSRG